MAQIVRKRRRKSTTLAGRGRQQAGLSNPDDVRTVPSHLNPTLMRFVINREVACFFILQFAALLLALCGHDRVAEQFMHVAPWIVLNRMQHAKQRGTGSVRDLLD